jgi:hypothetical protein
LSRIGNDLQGCPAWSEIALLGNVYITNRNATAGSSATSNQLLLPPPPMITIDEFCHNISLQTKVFRLFRHPAYLMHYPVL